MGKQNRKRRARRLMFAGMENVIQINGIGWLVESVQRHDTGASFVLTQGTAGMTAFIGREVLADLVEAMIPSRK